MKKFERIDRENTADPEGKHNFVSGILPWKGFPFGWAKLREIQNFWVDAKVMAVHTWTAGPAARLC